MRLTLATLPIVVLLALAPAASAGELTAQTATAYLRGDRYEPEALSVVWDGAAGTVRLRDSTTPLEIIGDRCSRVDEHEAVCDAAALTEVVVFAGEASDTITASASGPMPILLWLSGGAGNDTVVGGSGTEWIMGGDGNDVLDGGAGDDLINGGSGVDVLRGGEGDDRLVATEHPLDPPGADDELTCGSGTDRFRGDLAFDLRPVDCELQLAQFTGPARIAGEPRTGGTVTVSAPLVGTPAPTVSAVWWSCPDDEDENCVAVGHGITYAPRGSDVGHELYAWLFADNDTSPAFRSQVYDALESLRTAPVTGDPSYVPPAPPARTPPSLRVRSPRPPVTPSRRPSVAAAARPSASALATTALGGPVALAPGARHPIFSAYVRTGRKGILRIGRRPVAAVAVISRQTAPAAVEQVLELKPRGSEKLRRVRLSRAQVNLSPSTATVIRVGLSPAQRRLVRSARSARLLVRIGGQPPAVVSFRLRLGD